MKKTVWLAILLVMITVVMSTLLFACEGITVENNGDGIIVRPIDSGASDTGTDPAGTDPLGTDISEDDEDHEHVFGAWTVVLEASCTTNGKRKKACECGEEVEESISALGHQIESHAAKAASCTEVGWAAYDTCARCNYTTYEEIPAKGHRADDTLSCTDAHECADCGKSFTMEHVYNVKASILQQSCMSAGVALVSCGRCGEETERLQDALGHQYELTSKRESTCTTGGADVYTCKNCRESYTITYSALGHDTARGVCSFCGENITVWDDEIAAINAECDEGKRNEQQKQYTINIKKRTLESLCSSYGTSVRNLSSTSFYQSKKNSSYQSWMEYTTRANYAVTSGDAARYRNMAQQYYELYSGYTRLLSAAELRDEIEELEEDLDYRLWCIEGYRTQEIQKINNKYEGLSRPSKPSVSNSTFTGLSYVLDGEDHYTLSGYNGGEGWIHPDWDALCIPATFNGKAVTKIAAGAFEGWGIRVLCLPTSIVEIGEGAFRNCANLETVYYHNAPSMIGAAAFSGTKYVEAWEHDLVRQSDLAPTCLSDGYHDYYTCSRCAYETKEIDEALGHDPIKQDDLAPTCLSDGYHDRYVCSRCAYETKVTDEALGHAIESHEAKSPTCKEIGWNAYETCSRCDYTTYEEIPFGAHEWDHPEYLEEEHPGDYELICAICGETLQFHIGLFTRVDADNVPSEVGQYVLFGKYPQSLVEERSIVSALTEAAGDLPTTDNDYLWSKSTKDYRNYHYYEDESYCWIPSSEKDNSYCIDVVYLGKKYRGIYDGIDIVWYRFDPIKWRILSESDGVVTIIADSILDAGFSAYGSSFEDSEVRQFLDDEFISTAFSIDQQEAIIINDGHKVFLLGEDDVRTLNANVGKTPTAYAKIYSAALNGSSDSSLWMLSTSGYYGIQYVYPSGSISDYDWFSSRSLGIAPALRISLS